MLMNKVDRIILGFCFIKKKTFNEVKNYWYPTAKSSFNAKLIYLIGNFIDRENDREVNEKEAKTYAKENNLRYFETSCKTKKGRKEFWNELVNEIIKIKK